MAGSHQVLEPLPKKGNTAAGLLHLLRQPRHVVGDARVVSTHIPQLGVDVHWQAPRLYRRAGGRAGLVHVVPLQMDAARHQTVLGGEQSENGMIPALQN